MLDAEDHPPSQLTVLFAGRDFVRRLNREFRGEDRATDVLSFPAGEGPELEEEDHLGDIVVCLPIAQEQARAHKTSVETECACLAVHGALHLLGYEHRTEAEYEVMMDKTLAAVRKAGLKPNPKWESLPH
ncbi:MAG: endoribonuclease YbeY [Fimbriimonadales bacterium]|nr:MAG: endoribonuclease YbeY [Fimbriimonadales bacterium]